MAAPDDRLSTEPVLGDIIPPDDIVRELNADYEAGPVAVSDTSEGLFYQTWALSFAGGTFTITPAITLTPVDVLTGQDSVQCSLAFDQNGRPHIAWEDSAGEFHLYWYDTTQAQFVITDLGSDLGGIMLCLDDKRVRQTGASDILMWYTKQNGATYDLYQCRQRDRFDPPILQKSGVWPLVMKVGMSDALRVQIELVSTG